MVCFFSSVVRKVFLTAFSPRPLPHRFLFRPRFSSRVDVTPTLRTTKEKTHQKSPPTQANEIHNSQLWPLRKFGNDYQLPIFVSSDRGYYLLPFHFLVPF